MPNNFLRAVIFDFGGTLMYGRQDWEPIIAQADDALTSYLRSQGMELNITTFPHQFRKSLAGQVEFVGFVLGKGDRGYQKLAAKLNWG